MKNPLPIRFSGTGAQDCDTVLSRSPPPGQPARRSASVGLSACSATCVDGLAVPAALSPASPRWPMGPGSPAQVSGAEVNVVLVRNNYAVWRWAQHWAAYVSCPWSLDYGGGPTNVQHRTQGWPAERCKSLFLKFMPQHTHHVGKVQSTDYFIWKGYPLRDRG